MRTKEGLKSIRIIFKDQKKIASVYKECPDQDMDIEYYYPPGWFEVKEIFTRGDGSTKSYITLFPFDAIKEIEIEEEQQSKWE